MRKRWRTTEAIQARAKELHRNQTPAEQKLWAKLRGEQLCGLRFRRQHPIGHCVVDFCCLARKLVIEIDGDSHASQVEYDQDRTAYLEERGYTVIRFINDQVHHQIDDVLTEIVRQCEELEEQDDHGEDSIEGGSPHPSPPPLGGGGSQFSPRERGELEGGLKSAKERPR